MSDTFPSGNKADLSVALVRSPPITLRTRRALCEVGGDRDGRLQGVCPSWAEAMGAVARESGAVHRHAQCTIALLCLVSHLGNTLVKQTAQSPRGSFRALATPQVHIIHTVSRIIVIFSGCTLLPSAFILLL